MSDIETDMAKMHQELATHNSEVAAQLSVKTNKETTERLDVLHASVNSLTQKVLHLEQKYNLLLSKNFNTGPTVSDDNS